MACRASETAGIDRIHIIQTHRKLLSMFPDAVTSGRRNKPKGGYE